ncbi:MAG: septum formation initiator family protein [Fidelibacterota bacterium]|nr:MAG: septum formation initiator family protein [Candidatus Neomarinimicrobiota bacterium]
MPPTPRRRNRRKQARGASRLKRWATAAIILFVLLFISLNQHGLLRLHRVRTEQKRLEVEITLLQERAVGLRQEMASLEQDMVYIERLAREKYRMVKRGEKVFRVVNTPSNADRNEGTNIPR